MSTEQQPGGAPSRTLADDLRARDDSTLAELLRTRPDLLSPVPGDLTQLATRAGTRASVVRAVERLDRFALQAAEALAVAGDPCSYEELRALLTGAAPEPAERATVDERLPRALDTLRTRALLWGADDRLRLVRTAREVFAPATSRPSPTGLGPSLAEATSGMSPGRLQEILSAAGLPATHDPVSALRTLGELFTDRRRMTELLSHAPRQSMTVLGKLVWGPPYGTAQHRSAGAPLAWLLDRGLLLPTGERTVVLPREVALHLRGGSAHRDLEALPPPVDVRRAHPPESADAAGAAQAFGALDTLEELLGCWEIEPPSVLRAGGLGVRELRRAAGVLDRPAPETAFWLELAYSAGLLASDGEVEERYVPTPDYDAWLREPAERRWARLVEAWLPATRVPGLVGARDGKGRSLAALGAGLDRGLAPDVRQRTLTLLAELPAGAAAEPESVVGRLRWERPLRGSILLDETGTVRRSGQPGSTDSARSSGRAAAAGTETEPEAEAPHERQDEAPDAPTTTELRTRLAQWTLTEAELLGLTGRGALTSYARLLTPAAPADARTAGPNPASAPEPAPATSAWEHPRTAAELATATDQAARALAPLLPEPVDHVLLQADLTAVAPGPLERQLGARLAVLADVESKGGATVYRFTPESVRRALDSGQTTSELHAFLSAHSRTPVPQPLSYLIDDVARRHGQLRVGAALAYLRCDDEALLTQLLADKRTSALQLRQLAPTVLVSATSAEQLLSRLRELGYAPAAESADGAVLVARPDAHRSPHRTPPEPVPDGPPRPDEALLTAAVRAIRAGDHAATAVPKPQAGARPPAADGELPRSAAAETLATMQTATLSGASLWIGYVNADGAASQRVIAPVRVEGGFVTAYDHTADEVRTYPLHRITGVTELAES